jgi:hypothetical protein
MTFIEKINYSYSNNLYTIMATLNKLPQIVAMDFETASKWTDTEKEEMKEFLKENEDIDREEKRQIRQFIESTGLSHPSFVHITHFSVAWSPTDAFVAVLDTEQKRKALLRWLVTTDRKQIWHNLSFDGKHIMYHTGKLPKNYEDSEILARTLLNHVNTFKAKSGLKVLMGYAYGEWAVSKDNFNLDNMYDEELIKYAGIDACATYKLWLEEQESIEEQ